LRKFICSTVTRLAYQRRKTGVTVLTSFGDEVAGILKALPQVGQLFPALARIGFCTFKSAGDC